MMKNRFLSAALAVALIGTYAGPVNVLASELSENHTEQTVTLRVCNWEEYIDLGGWDEDEVIDLDSGDVFGEHNMCDDFAKWYYETYGVKVKVEYSTFGTNEDLYNMLTLGDEYDIVCPSEYMFMKLMAEDQLVPLSDGFFDTEDENNYYIKGVSPYIKDIFDNSEINGEVWSKYAAGYMWGVTGIVYNPEVFDREDGNSWAVMTNKDYYRTITTKDNVRDAYFIAVAAVKKDLLTSEEFLSDPDYKENLEREMNDVSPETIAKVQDYLQETRDNVYSFETDSGKADLISGKIAANYQWSGDAVYSMDQADVDGVPLEFVVPQEASNIYFDGWVMLKNGIKGNALKQHAAESFINFVSRPDNAIRNMYYVGYTSVISGGEDERVFEYLDWNYGADEEEEETVDYDVSYFFSPDQTEGEYVIAVTEDQQRRQLYGQYPDAETVNRTSIMICFDKEQNANINKMWTNIRCFNILKVPVWGWILIGGGLAIIIALLVRNKKLKKH